jgi:hypothetical protein
MQQMGPWRAEPGKHVAAPCYTHLLNGSGLLEHLDDFSILIVFLRLLCPRYPFLIYSQIEQASSVLEPCRYVRMVRYEHLRNDRIPVDNRRTHWGQPILVVSVNFRLVGKQVFHDIRISPADCGIELMRTGFVIITAGSPRDVMTVLGVWATGPEDLIPLLFMRAIRVNRVRSG